LVDWAVGLGLVPAPDTPIVARLDAVDLGFTKLVRQTRKIKRMRNNWLDIAGSAIR